MRHLLTILAALLLCSAPLHAQTLKSLMYNSTNGQVVANTGTNVLTFTNQAIIQGNPEGGVKFSVLAGGFGFYSSAIDSNILYLPTDDTVQLYGPVWNDPSVRASLGFSTNLNTLWTATNSSNARSAVGLGWSALTNTNVTNFRSAIGLGATNEVWFATVSLGKIFVTEFGEIEFEDEPTAAGFRTNLGLGATNIVTFAGLTNNGDITINQTTATNGLLYIRRTNNEAFLGLANLIASNNTTVSNETLFRVGVAELTNKSAQFGFRSTNTNGNGVAVFSVFGFNALMQIGADASTNAVIYSGGGTNNEVMTLICDGATEFARPLRFSTNAASKPATNAPANTTNVAAWVEMRIGTNSYRVPLYQ